DALEAGVGHQLEAAEAGRRRHVDVRAVHAHAVARGLDDGVRLGVHRAHAVAVLHHVAVVVTMGQATDRSVVAGGEDHAVAHDHSADMLAIAGGSRRDLPRDRHEVFVPARSCCRRHGRCLYRGGGAPTSLAAEDSGGRWRLLGGFAFRGPRPWPTPAKPAPLVTLHCRAGAGAAAPPSARPWTATPPLDRVRASWLGCPTVQHHWFEKPRRLQRATAVCVALMCGGAALAIAARDDHASA